MRILLVTPTYPPALGGIELLLQRLASNLPSASLRVLTFAADGPFPSHGQRGVEEVVRVGPKGGTRPATLWLNARIVTEVRSFAPDAILSGYVSMAPGTAAARQLFGTPVVQYLYAREFETRLGLSAWALRHADAAIAISTYTRGLAMAAGMNAERINLIPPAIDPPLRAPPPWSDRASRPTILTVSRLVERYKGHDTMLRALPLIRSRVPDVEWVVLGGGPLQRTLALQAEASGVAHCVRFLGSASDATRERWFRQAHVFALLSRVPPGGIGGEGFGIAFVEAGARGLPVVAGRAAGVVDAVEDGLGGLLIDPQDHVAAADAVCDLLLNPFRAEALGREGAQRALRANWSTMADRVSKVLNSVVAAGKQP